jgi:hypothetical protein
MLFAAKIDGEGGEPSPIRSCDLRLARWLNLADMGEAIYIIS